MQEVVDPIAEGGVETGAVSALPTDPDAAVDDAAVQPEDVTASPTDPDTAIDDSTVQPDAVGALHTDPDATVDGGDVASDAAAPADDAGQRPTFRNRAGRRMAGRRVAQSSSRGGQGGGRETHGSNASVGEDVYRRGAERLGLG